MQTVKPALFILMCLVLVAACGLRGPLYLPDAESAVKTTDKQETTATAIGPDSEEDEDIKPSGSG